MGRYGFALVAVLGCGGGEIANTPDGGDRDGSIGDIPVTAALSITPTAADFGSLSIGLTSARIFTVSNSGTGMTGTLSAIVTGADAAAFHATSTCTTLATAGTCVVSVTFTPSSLGARTANLVVAASPGGTVMATLTAEAIAPTLTITPSDQQFGAIDLCGSSPDFTFTLANTGDVATGPLGAPVFGGANAAQFVIVSQTCTGVTLMPNSANSCEVVARFDPATVGAVAATLSVTAAPGGTAVAALSGSGDAASGFYIAPTTTNFGAVAVGSTSPPTTYTVTNVCRTATATLSTVLAGADPGDFAIGANTCQGAVLAPLTGSCTIAAAFTPHSTGAKGAALTVSNNAQPATAALTGTGN